MNMYILTIIIEVKEKQPEKTILPIIESGDPMAIADTKPEFGSLDMWKLRGGRRNSRNYQTSDKFSI